jgi:aminopeptidase S
VTGAAAGSSAGANDVDGGTTTIRSTAIRLPEDPAAYGNLTFSWVFAHSAGSSPDDALRVLVETGDGSQAVVFEVLGRPENVSGSWRTASIPLAAWAGQPIRLLFATTDGGSDNLVEAAVDDVRIRRP